MSMQTRLWWLRTCIKLALRHHLRRWAPDYARFQQHSNAARKGWETRKAR